MEIVRFGSEVLIGQAVLAFFILLCLTLFFLTIAVHARTNAFERRLEELTPVYQGLMESIRHGHAMAEDIKKTVLPRDFPTFQRFLKNTISSVENIDVAAERLTARVSGFSDHLRRRIANSRGWKKTLAVRILSELRDEQDIPLFRDILENDPFPQAAYAAGLGLALCKDTGSVVAVVRRLWQVSDQNRDAVLLTLYLYGKDIAPIALRALEDGTIVDVAATAVVLNFLSENPTDGAAAVLERLLQKDPPEIILEALLNAVRRLGTRASLGAVTPYLSHKNFTVRIEALLAVAELGGPESLHHLESGMNDENGWVRRAAAKGITRSGHPGILLLRLMAAEAEDKPKSAARTILAELEFNRLAGVEA